MCYNFFLKFQKNLIQNLFFLLAVKSTYTKFKFIGITFIWNTIWYNISKIINDAGSYTLASAVANVSRRYAVIEPSLIGTLSVTNLVTYTTLP